MRTFIAIELPGGVEDALQALSGRLRRSGVRATWVKRGRMHLTLRFLGEVSDDRLARLREVLARRYRGLAHFTLQVSGTGAFPNARKPSVVWAGAGPLGGGLAEAQAIAEEAARGIGLRAEKRPFHPHLTIARIKDPDRAGSLVPLLVQERDFDGGSISVSSVSLFSSQLTPNGPIYDRLQEFAF